jgi:hypothetical protein
MHVAPERGDEVHQDFDVSLKPSPDGRRGQKRKRPWATNGVERMSTRRCPRARRCRKNRVPRAEVVPTRLAECARRDFQKGSPAPGLLQLESYP